MMTWFDKSKASYANKWWDEIFMIPVWPKTVVENSCISKNEANWDVKNNTKFQAVSEAKDSWQSFTKPVAFQKANYQLQRCYKICL